MSDAYVRGPVEARRSPFLELEQSDWDAMVAEDAECLSRGTRLRPRAAGRTDRLRLRRGRGAADRRRRAGRRRRRVPDDRGTGGGRRAREHGVTANVVVPALEPDTQAVEAVVAFLLSDDARGVTGAVIAADGGFSITKQSTPSPLLDERT